MELPSLNVEEEWADHTNNSWASKDCDSLALRDCVETMYESLVSNKEVRVIPASITCYNDLQMLPDFQYEPSQLPELEQYITILLSAQLELARHVCSSTPFAALLKKRLLILKRIYYALCTRYHDRDKIKHTNDTRQVCESQREPLNGSQALLEVAVETGLTFLFALLQQNWRVSLNTSSPSLCNPILENAVSLLDSFPPLSLSNDSQLTPLGIKCLERLSNFLKMVILDEDGADLKGRTLASELLLTLALQRGSLRYLLEWIEVALECSTKSNGEEIRSNKFGNALNRMHHDNERLRSCKNYDYELSMFEGASLLMQKLLEMAVDYDGAHLSANERINSNGNCMTELSEIYVWGSNSSHQLATGNQEKIVTPIKSEAFGSVLQVSFVNFYLYSNLT